MPIDPIRLQGNLALAEQIKPRKQDSANNDSAPTTEPVSGGTTGPVLHTPPFPFETNGEKPISIDTIFDSPVQSVTIISGTGEAEYNGDARANIVIDNSNGSTVVVNAGAGDDVVSANGTGNLYNINTGTGNDTVDINGLGNKGLVSTGGGNDTANVSGDFNDQTVLMGNGDDTAIVSSDAFGNNLAIDGGENAEVNGDLFILDGYSMEDITGFSYNSETGVAYLQDKNGNSYEIRNFESIALRPNGVKPPTGENGETLEGLTTYGLEQFQQAWWDSMPPIFPPDLPIGRHPVDPIEKK